MATLLNFVWASFHWWLVKAGKQCSFIDAVDLAIQACMSEEERDFLRSVLEKEKKQNEWIGIMGGDKTAVSRRKRELKNRMKKYMLQHYADLIDEWKSGL